MCSCEDKNKNMLGMHVQLGYYFNNLTLSFLFLTKQLRNMLQVKFIFNLGWISIEPSLVNSPCLKVMFEVKFVPLPPPPPHHTNVCKTPLDQ